MMYGSIVGGWAVGLYFTRILWENARLLLVTHQTYVFWYICATGFISFILCYRVGPPTNRRSIDIIKWGLQLSANAIIYSSSEYKEVAIAVIILLFTSFYFPHSWLLVAKRYW